MLEHPEGEHITHIIECVDEINARVMALAAVGIECHWIEEVNQIFGGTDINMIDVDFVCGNVRL